jgi:hypothetical protein
MSVRKTISASKDSNIRTLGLWLKRFCDECHEVSVTAITDSFEPAASVALLHAAVQS